jgi:hypothetical protein
MTSPTDPTNPEFEEQLRQILKAEADSVAPSGEALQLIRDRTDRHRGSAWFGLPWLRPALAVAGAALIAASVLMSTPQVRDQVLEIVPAGANREGTPPAEDHDDPAVAVPDPSTDSGADPTAPSGETAEEPASSPSHEEARPSDDDEDVSVTSTCPPPDDGSASAAEERTDSQSEDDTDECDPSDEPSEGGGGDQPGDGGGTDPDGGEEPAPGDGGGTGSGEGGSSPTTGDGSSPKSLEE